MRMLNIAGYQFIALNNIPALRDNWLSQCRRLDLKGTIILSPEGVNINLAGHQENIRAFLQADVRPRFPAINCHFTWSDTQPFRHLKIKLKKEIITFRQPDANPVKQRAPALSPLTLKQWLDEKRDITLLDTRNDYEVRFGSFAGAIDLHLEDFGQFPENLDHLLCDKPIVMYCTGGIRCEKAALHLLNRGVTEVYQLNGGILGYFNQAGGAHYEGECFVFDERISLKNDLKISGTRQCRTCQGPVTQTQEACPACHAHQV